MPSTDITYCTRRCGNMECKRNKEYMKDEWGWWANFEDCKEWRERSETH